MKRTRHLPRTLGAMLGVIAVTAMTLVLPGLPGLATPAAAATSDRLIGEFHTYTNPDRSGWNSWPNVESEAGTLPPVAQGASGTTPAGGGVFTFPARGQSGPIVSQATGLCLQNSYYEWGPVRLVTCQSTTNSQIWHYDSKGRLLDGWDFGFTDGHRVQSDPIIMRGIYDQSVREVLIFEGLSPAVPAITEPADGAHTNATAPVLTGTGSVNDTLEVKDQFGKVWCNTTVQPGGSWSCTPKAGSGSPDRGYRLTAISTTFTGNIAMSDPITLTIDTVPPPAPVLTGPADGAHINSPAPEFSGTGETGNTVTVTNPKDPNTALCSAPVTDGAWSCTSSVSYGEGNHTFTPTATDPAGNVTAGSSITVTLDLTPPVEPVITTPVDGSATKTTALDFAGTSEGGSAVSVTDQEGTAICAAKASSDGKWACSSETPFTDGDYVFTPTAKDRAGNAAAGAGVSVTIDTVAPEAPVITAPTAGTVTNVTALPFAGTGENGSTVTVLGPDGGAVCTATVVDEAWACTADPELTEGEYAFTPVARDRAGNERTGTATAIRIDTTPPTTPVITAPEDGTFTNNVLPGISGTGETESAIVVRTEDGTEVCAATVVDGAWSCAPTAPLPEAEHALTAVSTDSAGNTATSAPVGVTVDLTVPSVPAITSPREGAFLNTPTPTITGTTEPGTHITVTSTNNTTLCTTTATHTTWECTPTTPLTDGTHPLTPTAKDRAGNTTLGATVTITTDTKNPETPKISTPKTDTLTATAALPLTGTGETGTQITVTHNDATICTATVTDGAWACTAATLPDGKYSFVPTATDRAGNQSTGTTTQVTIDATAPDAPVIVSPKDGAALNTPAPKFSGTAETGTTITLTDTDGDTVCTTTAKDGTWECTAPSEYAEGEHAFTATAKDPAGNVSTPTTHTITIDVTAPQKPVITAPADATIANTPKPALSGTGETGTTVTITDHRDRTLCSSPVTDGTWTCTPDTALTEGDHTFTPTAKDRAGNTASGAKTTFTLDVTAPAKPTVSAPADGDALNTQTPTLTGTAEPGSTVTITTDDGTPACTATVTGSGEWTCTLTSPLPEGTHPLTALVTDPAGNTSPGTTVKISIDVTAPTAPAFTSPQDGLLTRVNTLVFSGTGDTGTTLTVTDQNGAPVCQATVTEKTWACLPATTFTDGAHTFTPTAKDRAGNQAAGTPITVTIDTTPPTTPVIVSPKHGAFVNTLTPTITGTGETGTTLTLTDQLDTTLCTVTITDGAWSCPAPELEEGTHVFTPTAKDPAGNQSTGKKTKITIDVTAPDAPTITTPNDQTLTANPRPKLSGTAETGTTVTITDQNSLTLCTTTAANGKWACTPDTALTDTTHTLTPTAKDQAGNTTTGTPIQITTDTTPPTTPVIVTPTDGTTTNTTRPTITGTGETGTTITITGQKDHPLCTTPVTNGTWECTPDAPLTDGDHPLTPTSTDEAGNTTTGTSVTLTIHTVAPTAPTIDSPEDGTHTATTTPTLTGTAPNGTQVTITHNDTTICTTPANNTKWECAPTTPLPDGEYTLSPTAKDQAGNTTTGTSVTLTIDTTAPTAPTIESPREGAFLNTPTPTITGTTEPGTHITVTSTNNTTLCTTTATHTTWECTPTTPLTDGTHPLTPTAKDRAGNTTLGATVTITTDTKNPETPVVSSPKDGDALNTGTPEFTGTGEPGGTVTITDQQGTTVCTAVVAPSGEWSCVVDPALAEGEHELTVTITDPAGNTSSGGTVSVTVDSGLPEAPVIVSPADGSSIASTTPVFSGTGADGTRVTVRVAPAKESGSSRASRANRLVVCSAEVQQGAWSCGSGLTLTEGRFTFTVSATNRAGTTVTGAPVTVTVDLTKPSTPAGSGCAVLADGTVRCSGTGETAGDTVVIRDGNGDLVCEATVPPSLQWSCESSRPVTEFPLSITVQDPAGNESGTTTLPSPPAIGKPGAGEVIRDPQPEISGTGTPGDTVEIRDENGTVVCSAVVRPDGTWSCTPAKPLPEGESTLTPVIVAPDGSESAGRPIQVVVDPAPLITEQDVSCVANADGTVTCSGTAPPGSKVEIADADGTTVCSTTADANGRWSCTTTGSVPGGSVSVTVTSPDGTRTTSITVSVKNGEQPKPSPKPTPVPSPEPTRAPGKTAVQPNALVSTGAASLLGLGVLGMSLLGAAAVLTLAARRRERRR